MRVWNPRHDLGGLEERDVKDATFLLWKGHCSVHQRFRPEHVDAFRAEHPDGEVIVHPECAHEVVEIADQVGSTERILEWVAAAPPGSVIAVGTEIHMVQRLARRAPRQDGRLARPADLPVLDDVPHRRARTSRGCSRTLVRGRAREPDRRRRRHRASGPGSRSSACSTITRRPTWRPRSTTSFLRARPAAAGAGIVAASLVLGRAGEEAGGRRRLVHALDQQAVRAPSR